MKIALAFSGGGYRASAFNLGVLTYLDRVTINGESLLKKVVALSTVSGGTITGARYAVGIKRSESMQEIYKALYDFFLNTDLVAQSVERLKSSQDWDKRVKSLINAFADLYDEHLFQGEKFGFLFEEEYPIHLKHISFNATEFATGKQFRFQVTEKVYSPSSGRYSKGIIGNIDYHFPESIACKIRMADILAASSCFPGGFEPINFPHDFVLPEDEEVIAFRQRDKFPIGLMDGGIVDNQGIEPILRTESRMRTGNPEKEMNNLDLIIISDVSSPYMESYVASKQSEEKGWRKWTLRKLRGIALVSLLLSLGLIWVAFWKKVVWLSIVATVGGTLATLLLLLIGVIKKQLLKVDILDIKKIKGFLDVKLIVFETLLKNRILSVMKLAGSVFMKQIRRLNFNAVYNDESWKNRRIMNAVYELKEGEKNTEKKFKKGGSLYHCPHLKASPKIQETSKKASAMETTLWFEDRHKADGDKSSALDSLIACGQYTLCFNLLEYIEELLEDKSNTNEHHASLCSCKTQLLEEWERFKADPYWLVEEYNK